MVLSPDTGNSLHSYFKRLITPSFEPGAKPCLRDMPHWVFQCRNLGEFLSDSGQVGAGGQLHQDVACGHLAATAAG